MCGITGRVFQRPVQFDDFLVPMRDVNHRGHSCFGMATPFGRYVAPGFVRDGLNLSPAVYALSELLQRAPAFGFIGHTRYPTVNPDVLESDLTNAQPLSHSHPVFGNFYLVQNGQIVHYRERRAHLERQGVRFTTSSDTEILAAMIAHSQASTLTAAVAEVIQKVPGAFSFLVINEQFMIGARDRYGIWPLKYDVTPDSIEFSSEEGGLTDTATAREVPAGGLVSVDMQNFSFQEQSLVSSKEGLAQCLIDKVYLSRPDEVIGSTVASVLRRALGRQLGLECPLTADVVVGVPNSGRAAATGYAQQCHIPYEDDGLVKVFAAPTRSFISAGGSRRHQVLSDKHRATRRLLEGKRVIIVDDTLVRSTTATKIVRMVREVGASEVILALAFPKIIHPCFNGIDIPNPADLPASYLDERGIAELIQADSVHYLSVEGTLDTFNQFDNRGWCQGCIKGHYPIDPSPIQISF